MVAAAVHLGRTAGRPQLAAGSCGVAGGNFGGEDGVEWRAASEEDVCNDKV